MYLLISYNLVEESLTATTCLVTGDKGNPYYSKALDADIVGELGKLSKHNLSMGVSCVAITFSQYLLN